MLYTILVAGKLQAFYLPIAYLTIIASMALGATLIFSEAGKKTWLKAGGIFILIIGLVLVSPGTADLFTQDVNTKIILQKIIKWASVGYPLTAMFFIGNFVTELISLKHERVTEKMPEGLYGALSVGAFAALVSMFFIGEKLLEESNSYLSWQESNKTFGQDVLARRERLLKVKATRCDINS